MSRILDTCRDALIAAILLGPIFWAYNKYYLHNTRQAYLYTFFSVYMSGVFAVVGLPDILYFRFSPNYNFVPFLYMFSDWENTLLNVVLFLPLGFFLPLLWMPFRSFWKTVFVGFLTTLTIELLQIFTFRATDINDLMTNTFGTVIGYLFGILTLRMVPGMKPGSDYREIPMVFGIAFGTMFFLHPLFSLLFT